MTPSATDKLKKVPLDTTVSEIVEGGLASVPASKVSGTLSTSNIPSLDASKITSGTLSSARIPSLATSKITSGTFADARIPSLAATKITSGTFASARLPVATSTAKGAVMPVAKTTDMTQSVGVDSSGRLYTKPASGGVTKIVAGSNVTISPDSGTGEVTISASGGGGGSGGGYTLALYEDYNLYYTGDYININCADGSTYKWTGEQSKVIFEHVVSIEIHCDYGLSQDFEASSVISQQPSLVGHYLFVKDSKLYPSNFEVSCGVCDATRITTSNIGQFTDKKLFLVCDMKLDCYWMP